MGPGQETGRCNKFCVGHHPAAKLDVVQLPVATATRVLTKPTVATKPLIFPPESSDEEPSFVETNVSASIVSYN